MTHRLTTTRLGPLLLAVDGAGALTGAWFVGQRHAPSQARLGRRDDTVAGDALAQLNEYLVGSRTRFELALAPAGTDFQRRVWDALRAIRFGATRTYGDLALELGSSPRAVGAAVGRNPISIVIPCHRVVGSKGELTGYAGGIDRKDALLRLERGEPLF